MTEPRQKEFDQALAAYTAAHKLFEEEAARYWAENIAKQKGRKGMPLGELTSKNFVLTNPPVYNGPERPKEKEYGIELPAGPEAKPPTPKTTIADFLQKAKDAYGFVPQQLSEFAFKTNYASLALKKGLSKEQVVGIYAFETGGKGTYDMQSGVNPVTKKGTPMSSALGYAQLLAANSVETIAEDGIPIADDILNQAAQEKALGHGPRAKELEAKAKLVLDMAKDVRGFKTVEELRKNAHTEVGIPSWSESTKYSDSDKGMAIHAVNLDGDIGPRVQITKVAKLLKYHQTLASKNPILGGWKTPSPSVLEIMNLAGPENGFAMAHPNVEKYLTSNFFSAIGYQRNPTMTKIGPNGREPLTGTELLEKIGRIMKGPNSRTETADEFSRIFDDLAAGKTPAAPQTATKQKNAVRAAPSLGMNA